jgi:hypothetical protein
MKKKNTEKVKFVLPDARLEVTTCQSLGGCYNHSTTEDFV